MKLSDIKRLPILLAVAVVAAALTISLAPANAQQRGGQGGGHGSSEAGNAGGMGGSDMSRGGGGGSQSLRDVFRGTQAAPSSAAKSDTKGGSAITSGGKKGSTTAGKKAGKSTIKAAEEEDSDRPAWAGKDSAAATPGRPNQDSGTKKGDVYGDMYVILRDENGVPILKEITLADGTKIYVVQPVDANGEPLPLDAEGNLIDATQAIAVDLGRLNVGRSTIAVLSSQYDELLKSINEADSVTVDESGRLVLVTDGVAAAVDSPLANLALYVELLNTGTITGVTDPSKFATDISYLVDGTKTTADLLSAASFLAAAADKTGTMTIDKIVDLNTILGVTGTLPSQDPTSTLTYVDYSSFSYDRESVYGSTTVTVLVKQDDGSYLPTTVNVYDAVFNSTNYTSTSGVDGFTQATDDALQVIEYIHDNSAPET